MAGVITVKCTVMKDGQKQLGMVNGKSPIFIPGPVQPQFGPGRMLYFEVSLSPFSVRLCWENSDILDVGRASPSMKPANSIS
jgi:hypothetical protein